jgi:hypothetical protein
VWSVGPTVSAPDNFTGSTITYTPGTNNQSATAHWVFTSDGVDIAGTEDDLTFVSDETYNLKHIRARTWAVGWAGAPDHITEEIVLLINETPVGFDTIDPAHIMIDEIRDPDDAGAGGSDTGAGVIGGRMRLKTHADLVIPPGHSLRWNANIDAPGTSDNAQKTNVLPGTTYGISFSWGVGVAVYNSLYLLRASDGVSFPALPDTGDTTAADWDVGILPAKAARAITEHPTVSGRGTVVVETLGLDEGVVEEFEWPALTTASRTLALAVTADTGSSLARYLQQNVGTNTNMNQVHWTGFIGCAMNSLSGDTTTDARCIEWLNWLLQSSNMPWCASRPGAARDSYFPAFCVALKANDRLWPGTLLVTPTMKTKITTIIKALLYANAAYISDTNTNNRTIGMPSNMLGWTGNSGEGFDSQFNLSGGPLMVVANCAAFLGLPEAAALLETVDISDFITEVNTNLGSGSNMGIAWNWRTTSQNVASFYRMGPHANAWTPAQFESRLRGWRTAGFALTDLMNVLLPNDNTGTSASVNLNRGLPPATFSQGSNSWAGLVWNPRSSRSFFDATSDYIVIDGIEFGISDNTAFANLPHKGDGDCMPIELNGLDEGTRAAMGYMMWTMAQIAGCFLGGAIAGTIDMSNTRMAAFLHRFSKAATVLWYIDQQTHHSIAHMISANGAAAEPTSYNGGPGVSPSADWQDIRVTWRMPVIHEVFKMLLRKLVVQLGPPSAFSSAAACLRWEGRGSAAWAYDAGENAGKLTISGAGGGVGNMDGPWAGSEPADYNTVGHFRFFAGVTHRITFRCKRGTYPSAAVLLKVGSTTILTTGVLTTSYADYTADYTHGASDSMGDISIVGSASNTGTIFFQPAEVGGRAIQIRPL